MGILRVLPPGARRRVRTTAFAAWGSVSGLVDQARRGNRTIIMTPPQGLRLGNLLYLWLRADLRTASGLPTLVLQTSAMDEWLGAFPALYELTLPRAALRFVDRREWDNKFLYQRFGRDFTANDLARFVHRVVEPFIGPPLSAHTVVVNVRRGDYYTDFADKYAFDQVGYIREALRLFGEIQEARIVSDDPAWCREYLDTTLRAVAPTVTYDAPNARANLLTLGSARRLIGSNSTFSYWGGYIATALEVDARIVMPRFHARMSGGRTDAHQLDPRWISVDGYS